MDGRYSDRCSAGQILAQQLLHYSSKSDVCVLALPRGGVPIGFEVARALNAPLDVFIVRKLGVPGQEELAMGAIASGGVRVLNTEVVHHMNVPSSVIDRVTLREEQELHRREQLYRGHEPPIDLKDKTAILVDDGLATGSTMRAAIAAVRQLRAARIVVAVPVAAPATVELIRGEVDEVVCPLTPHSFQAVGQWYDQFDQTTDEEVRALLAGARSG